MAAPTEFMRVLRVKEKERSLEVINPTTGLLSGGPQGLQVKE